MHIRYIPISMIPIFLDSRNLFIASVAYKISATNINARIVYSIEPESISIKDDEFAPIRIVFINQGMPRESNIFMVFAPSAFDTPIEPSPEILEESVSFSAFQCKFCNIVWTSIEISTFSGHDNQRNWFWKATTCC